MIKLKIGEHKCSIPNTWKELKIKDYIKLMKIFKRYEGEVKVENEESEPTEKEKFNNIKLNAEVLAEFTGLSMDTIKRCDEREITHCLGLMSKFLNTEVEKKEFGDKHSFKHKNKKYHFPIIGMRDSTFGDYIETAQLEMLAKDSEAGKFGVVAEQIAILCREENEEYDDDKIKKKTRLFEDLTMDICWDFIFFLNKQIQHYSKSSQTYLKQTQH